MADAINMDNGSPMPMTVWWRSSLGRSPLEVGVGIPPEFSLYKKTYSGVKPN